MKKIFTILSLSIISFSACKIYINTNDEDNNNLSFSNSKKELIQKIDLQKASIKDLKGNATSADFEIIGDDNTAPYVEVYAKAANKKLKKEDIEKLISNNYTLNIVTDNHLLNIEAIRQKNISFSNNNSVQFYFVIHTSSNLNTQIETTSGDLKMSNLTGTHNYTSTSGDAIFSKIKGNISMSCTSGDGTFTDVVSNKIYFHSTSGDITLTNCSSELNAITTSGDIIAQKHYGNTTSESTSGDISLELLKGSVQANATSGDVNVAISIPQEKINIVTTSGDVHLKAPQSIAADLDIHGSNISCNSLNHFSDGKGATNKYIIGKINGGGIPMKINSNSGDITIQWQ
ncbi:DUF4097 family beta strand repeat-containing protein [Rhizosphaericola mali]|uniref:DUF4097 domain-containing protein n=1 Tax=Rhizosphaericola mali TaxID=2545455 RepID=A0A5P2FZL6_9BACT|nr:DUF4097 family beta strand repeat-containing protein [Rhizosphaericola mali]QES87279.1 DUF4097 domain-containing protein [Rhizosphaericola mali]